MILLGVILVSGTLGFGLLLIYQAFSQPAISLDSALDRSQAPAYDAPTSLLDRIIRQIESIGSPPPGGDLELLGWSTYHWNRRRVMFVVVAATAGAVVTVGARLWYEFPVLLVIAFTTASAGALGLVVAESDRTTKAALARNEIRVALTQFLELTSIMLAGGAGAETALERASVNGHGRGFALFAREMARAKEDPRLTAFAALRDLGQRINVVELIEFGNVMTLSSENSATIRQALNDKASLIVFQDHERRRAEAASRNVMMSLPVVGMAIGFITWLVYAAIAGLNGY